MHGWHVHISEQNGSWYVALMPGGQWTERVLRVDSLADGARLARAWIEEKVPPLLSNRVRSPESMDGWTIAAHEWRNRP